MRSSISKKALSFTLFVACVASWTSPSMALRPQARPERGEGGLEELETALVTAAAQPAFSAALPAPRLFPPMAGLEERTSANPARLANEAEKRRILLQQAETAQWRDFAAQSLAIATAPQNFLARLEAFREGTRTRLASLKVPEPPPDADYIAQNLISTVFYTYLFLNSNNRQAVTLANTEKYAGNALSRDQIREQAQTLMDLLIWAETQFPAAARHVIEKEWQGNLRTLGLIDYEKPYGVDIAGKKNIGTTLFSDWAELADKNGATVNLPAFGNFLVNQINDSNVSEAASATKEIWGHDYGGISTRLAVLLGTNFVMMNPTLVRRSVWESADVNTLVRSTVQQAAKENPDVTGTDLWMAGTFAGGWSARMALFPTYVLTLGQAGQVSLQLDAREYDPAQILKAVAQFNSWLAEEAARSLDNFVVDTEADTRVVSEADLLAAFSRPAGKVNAVFKVDGSNPANYGDILEKALEVIAETGGLDLLELAKRTDSLVVKLHGQGIFTNYTAHGRVGIAAWLTHAAGNALARENGIPVHGAYITQMAGRLDEFLAESTLNLVRTGLQAMIDTAAAPAQPGDQEKLESLKTLLADVKKLAPTAQGSLNTVDAQGNPTVLGRAVEELNQGKPEEQKIVLPADDDVRRFGAIVMQNTEKMLTPMRNALGVTTNESAQLLASTRPWVVEGKLVHFAHTTGTSQNVKRGWFPSTGLVPLSKVEKTALRAHLSEMKAAAPGGIVEEIPAAVLARLKASSVGTTVSQVTEPTLQEAEIFEQVTGQPNTLGTGGLPLNQLQETRFMSFTFTGNYDLPKPKTSQQAKEGVGAFPSQFIRDSHKFEEDVKAWAVQPAAGTEETPELDDKSAAEVSALREQKALLPSAAPILSPVGLVAGPHATGLAYGVAFEGKVTNAVAFIVEKPEHAAGLEELGFSPNAIFMVGSSEYPTLDSAITAAQESLAALWGVSNAVELGTRGPVNQVLQQILENLFGIKLEEGDVAIWQTFIERVLGAFSSMA